MAWAAGPSVNPPPVLACPADPVGVTPLACPAAMACTQEFSCAGGPQTFRLDCGMTQGWIVNAACELPYDHCHATTGPSPGADCVEGQWQLLGVGGNPPAPCPREAPVIGATCRPGYGFGADREHCGYPCGDGGGWTVIGCAPSGPADGGVGPHAWRSDGACD